MHACMYALMTDQPFIVGPFFSNQAIRHAENDASRQEYERRLVELRAEALAEVGSRAYTRASSTPTGRRL